MYSAEFSECHLNTFRLIHQTCNTMYSLWEKEFSTINITPEQFTILWILRDFPTPLTLTALSRATFRAKSTILGILERMQNSDLIEKIEKNQGKPGNVAILTAKGSKVCEQGLLIMKVLYRQLAPSISDEEHRSTQNVLQKLLKEFLRLQRINLESPPGTSQEKSSPLKW